jgi:hypothetical protein
MNVVNERAEQYVEKLPGDLDSFMSDFFPRRKWRTRVQYDHRAHRFFLDITVRDQDLAADDRFLSLLAFYGRGQRRQLRERAGLDLNFRLFSSEGVDLTPLLQSAETRFLDDDARGGVMGRRLAWLSFRQRFLHRVAPRSLLWAVAMIVLVAGFGFTVPVAVGLCFVAVVVQIALTAVIGARGRRR